MRRTKRQEKQGDAPDPNELLARNIKAILGSRTAEAYCKERKPVYVSGTKKGKKVGARTIRALLLGEFSPRLDFVAAIAYTEELEPYQLMFYDFDPENAPVMISRSQQDLIDQLKRAPKPAAPAMAREEKQ